MGLSLWPSVPMCNTATMAVHHSHHQLRDCLTRKDVAQVNHTDRTHLSNSLWWNMMKSNGLSIVNNSRNSLRICVESMESIISSRIYTFCSAVPAGPRSQTSPWLHRAPLVHRAHWMVVFGAASLWIGRCIQAAASAENQASQVFPKWWGPTDQTAGLTGLWGTFGQTQQGLPLESGS
jgi:hypothetical protein